MEKDKLLKKNPNIVTRVIGDEVILLPVYKTSDEINCIYTLNHDATEVWKLINGKLTNTQIKAKLLKKLAITPKVVDKEMSSFLKDLKKVKAVIEIDS